MQVLLPPLRTLQYKSCLFIENRDWCTYSIIFFCDGVFDAMFGVIYVYEKWEWVFNQDTQTQLDNGWKHEGKSNVFVNCFQVFWYLSGTAWIVYVTSQIMDLNTIEYTVFDWIIIAIIAYRISFLGVIFVRWMWFCIPICI